MDMNTVRCHDDGHTLKSMKCEKVQNRIRNVPKDSMNSPLPETEIKFDDFQPYQGILPKETLISSTPSFNSLSNGGFEHHLAERLNRSREGSVRELDHQSFSDMTKCIINKDLLENTKDISEVISQVHSCMEKLKQYYNLAELENYFGDLKELLNDSFQLAFSQIVDLHMQNNSQPEQNLNAEEKLKEEEYKLKYKKAKHLYRQKCMELEEVMKNYHTERDDLLQIIKSNNKDIQELKSVFSKNSDNSGYIEQIENLKMKIEKVENEREHANFYAKELEEELKKTKEALHDNKVNLIDPLKNRLAELDNLIQVKEQKVKRTYKRKLKRVKRELENEKKINVSLAKRISILGDRSISQIQNMNAPYGEHFNDRKIHQKSHLDVARSRSNYSHFDNHIDMNKLYSKHTIDTPSRSRMDDHPNEKINSARSNPDDSYNGVRRNRSENRTNFRPFAIYKEGFIINQQQKSHPHKNQVCDENINIKQETAEFKKSLKTDSSNYQASDYKAGT